MAKGSIRHGGKPLDVTLTYIDSCRKTYPGLCKVFDLYAAIFTVQRRFYDGFAPEPNEGLPDPNSGRPALVGSVAGVELASAQEALAEISAAIADAAPERETDLGSLPSVATTHADAVAAGLPGTADGSVCGNSSVARTIFLLALNPFYEKTAVGIVPSVADMPWQFGYCPICGERPSISRYEESSGARFVQCGLCRTQWGRGRVVCVFCDNRNQEKLGYLSDAPDSAFRVEVCDVCRRYMKTVDERALGREAILHVEELTMLSLDREALAKGYQP